MPLIIVLNLVTISLSSQLLQDLLEVARMYFVFVPLAIANPLSLALCNKPTIGAHILGLLCAICIRLPTSSPIIFLVTVWLGVHLISVPRNFVYSVPCITLLLLSLVFNSIPVRNSLTSE